MGTPKENAEVMIEQLKHPERFCSQCGKRLGVCRHTNPERTENIKQFIEVMNNGRD